MCRCRHKKPSVPLLLGRRTTLFDEFFYYTAVIQKITQGLVVVYPRDYLGKQPGYICLYIPFFLEEFFVIYRVGADYAVKVALAVGFVELLDGVPGKEGKAYRRDNLRRALFLRNSIALRRVPPCRACRPQGRRPCRKRLRGV